MQLIASLPLVSLTNSPSLFSRRASISFSITTHRLLELSDLQVHNYWHPQFYKILVMKSIPTSQWCKQKKYQIFKLNKRFFLNWPWPVWVSTADTIPWESTLISSLPPKSTSNVLSANFSCIFLPATYLHWKWHSYNIFVGYNLVGYSPFVPST